MFIFGLNFTYIGNLNLAKCKAKFAKQYLIPGSISSQYKYEQFSGKTPNFQLKVHPE
jgi:hypothetical protein